MSIAAVTAEGTEVIAAAACPEKQQSRIKIRFLAGLSASVAAASRRLLIDICSTRRSQTSSPFNSDSRRCWRSPGSARRRCRRARRTCRSSRLRLIATDHGGEHSCEVFADLCVGEGSRPGSSSTAPSAPTSRQVRFPSSWRRKPWRACQPVSSSTTSAPNIWATSCRATSITLRKTSSPTGGPRANHSTG